jgi:hypothetical protein
MAAWIPPRPDPAVHPRYARWWSRVYGGKVRWVEASVSVTDRRPARRPRNNGEVFGIFDRAGAQRAIDPENPSGGYSTPATFVAAHWYVPTIIPIDPDGTNNTIDMGIWVGMDAFDGDQILQGGIGCEVEAGLFTNDSAYYAWAEWFTDECEDPAIHFNNFPVAAGDVIACLVMALDPNTGLISMANISRNHGSSMTLSARPGIPSQGGDVEWAVEQVTDVLPTFTPVLFEGCIAGSAIEEFGPEPGPGTDIFDDKGRPATHSWVLTPDAVLIRWAGFSDAGTGPPDI